MNAPSNLKRRKETSNSKSGSEGGTDGKSARDSIDNHLEIPENDDCDDFVSSAKRIKSSKQIYVYESEDDDELVILDWFLKTSWKEVRLCCFAKTLTSTL